MEGHHKSFTRLLHWLLVAISILGYQSYTLAFTTPNHYLEEFEHYVNHNVAPEVPGAALIIVANGEIQLLKNYGVKKAGSTELVTKDTVFRLASVSKTFASAAIELLIENGLLHWDTSIQSLLEHVQFKNSSYGQNITLKNLISHTTGLVPHAYTHLIEANVPYDDIIYRLREVDFVCEPGQCYTYQNIAFNLVGDVVQAVTGQSYETFVIEQIFAPLGMKHASFGLPSLAGDNYAIPHIWKDEQWLPVEITEHYYTVAPAAGANASIADMGQWLLAQLGHRPDVLSHQALDDLHNKRIQLKPHQAHYVKKEPLGDVYYGAGWRVFDFGLNKNFVHHSGAVRGARATVVLNRDLQIGMAFLTNAETRHVKKEDLMFKFLTIYDKYHKEQVVAMSSSGTSGASGDI